MATASLSKMQWMVFLLGFFKIPLLGYVRPKLVSISEEKVEVKIRLRRRTKNHLNSMYFGALAVGADVAGGVHAFYFAQKYGKQVSFAFKSMEAQFLKRAESDILFVCNSGHTIEQAVKESMETGLRINQKVHVEALNSASEAVANFVMEISVKVK